jgi:Family of unknown function (DUF5684)
MENMNFFQKLWENNPGIFLLTGFILFVGLVGRAKMFAKADQPVAAAFVPVWDMIVTMKIVGRPTSHVAYFLVPGFNIYFGFKILIEVAQSFGKTHLIDYVLVCLFNVFYVLNLALAYNEEYMGPVYGLDLREVQQRKPALV